jgi:chemotaxis protein methyltransferase CheR
MVGRELTVTQRELGHLCRVLEAHAGLSISEASQPMLIRRLGDRATALGLRSLSKYAELIESKAGDSELQTAVDIVTTAETYFLRQAYQLRAFAEEVLPTLIKRNESSKKLTIWSAGCATGEEAYTLASIVADSPLLREWTVKVIGTDISVARLNVAREGLYGKSSFRAADESFRERHFTKTGEQWRVAPELRRMCQFLTVNLAVPHAATLVGRVDVVFCRNVMIYLSERGRRVVTRQLVDRLVPGGVLFVGHAESLLSADLPLNVLHLREDVAYERRGEQR